MKPESDNWEIIHETTVTTGVEVYVEEFARKSRPTGWRVVLRVTALGIEHVLAVRSSRFQALAVAAERMADMFGVETP